MSGLRTDNRISGIFFLLFLLYFFFPFLVCIHAFTHFSILGFLDKGGLEKTSFGESCIKEVLVY